MIHRLALPFVALTLTAATAVAAPLAAASSGGTDADRIANSGQALLKAGSASFTGKVKVTGSTPSGRGNVSFNGAFDFKRRSGQFKIDASALGRGGSGQILFLLVNNVEYISIAAFNGRTSSTLPKAFKGKKWLKLDLKVFDAAGGQVIGQTDPSSTLFALRGVTQDIQNLGTDRVGGATTTHYRIHLDLAKALQQVPASQRAIAQQALQALGGNGVVPAEVWLDSQSRLRRFSLTLHITMSGATSTISETFEFSNFGTHVSVSAPPPNETVDFTQLFSGLGRGVASSTS